MGVRKEFIIILTMAFFVAMSSVVASDTDNATQEVLSIDTSDDNVSVSTVEVDNVEKSSDDHVINELNVTGQNLLESNEIKNTSQNVLSNNDYSNYVKKFESTDNELLRVPFENDLLRSGESGGTFYQLNQAISTNTGTCTLTGDFSATSTDYLIATQFNPYRISSSGVEINKNLVVVGSKSGRVLLDANSLGRIFNIGEGYTVTFRNIIFQEASYANNNGGAVSIGARSKVTFENCIFRNNAVRLRFFHDFFSYF